MENIKTNCAICCSELNEPKNECSEPDPSASSSRHFLEAQLNVIFTLRDIFELEAKQIEVYLREWGNPGEWLKFCRRCEEDVNNIRCIYQRLHQISRELDSGKCVLRKRVLESTPKQEGQGVISECRRKFCTKYKKKELVSPTMNPFDEGDLLASQLALNIKVEENVSFNDDLEMFHDENSSSSSRNPTSSYVSIPHAESPNWSWEAEVEIESSNDDPRRTRTGSRRRNLRSSQKANHSEDSGVNDDDFSSYSSSKSKSKRIKTVKKDEEEHEGKRKRKLRMRSKFGVSVHNPNGYRRPIKCPFCNSSCPMNEEIFSFSRHLQDCAISISHSESIDNLKCSLCMKWSCISNEIRKFLEHVVMCRDNHDGDMIPWRHAAFKCNLCQDSCYLPFPEYTYHVFTYHQHSYGCTQCGFRASSSGKIARAHWRSYHKLFPDTPTRERYRSLPQGEKMPLPQIPWWCPAPQCLQQFSDESSRDLHLPHCQDFLPERKLNCSFCGRDYFCEEELLMHRVSVHGYLRLTNAHHCKECNITFENKRQLSRHQRIQHSLNLFRCNECGLEFRTCDARGSHVRLEHGRKEDLEEFKCQICDTVFGWRHQLRKHIAQVHEKVAKVCEKCGKEFEDEVAWKGHMSKYHPARQGKPRHCLYPDCGKVLRSSIGFKLHIAKHANQLKLKESRHDFMCSFCGKMLATRAGLRIHTKRCRLPRFTCRKCKLKFSSQGLLKEHKVTVHGIRGVGRPSISKRKDSLAQSLKKLKKEQEQRRPKSKKAYLELDSSKVTLSEDKPSRSCNICKKSFNTLKRLKHHMSILHDAKKNPEICSNCGGNFPSQVRLQIHMATVHGEGVKCDACDKLFATDVRLKLHRKYCKSNDCIPSSFSCSWDSCGKVFRNQQYLNQHVKQVHKSCHLCGATRSNEDSLRQHMENVHGQRKKPMLECPVCQKIFVQKKSFQIHVKSCHSSDSEKNRKMGCCEICGVGVSQWYLPKHRAEMHGMGDFKCDVEGCSKAFLKMCHLEDHKKYGHEGLEKAKTWFCQFCGKGFAKSVYVKRHEDAMHWNVESKPFKCELCDKTFSVKEYLWYHLRYTHNKIKKKKEEEKPNVDSKAEPSLPN